MKKKGFTLVELLAVIVLLGILMTLGIPTVMNLVGKNRNKSYIEDAKRLIKLLEGMNAHVNLIPINKIENGKYSKSSTESIIKFRDYLNDHGITATIRRELGSDIDAACGQLRRKNINKQT